MEKHFKFNHDNNNGNSNVNIRSSILVVEWKEKSLISHEFILHINNHRNYNIPLVYFHFNSIFPTYRQKCVYK